MLVTLIWKKFGAKLDGSTLGGMRFSISDTLHPSAMRFDPPGVVQKVLGWEVWIQVASPALDAVPWPSPWGAWELPSPHSARARWTPTVFGVKGLATDARAM